MGKTVMGAAVSLDGFIASDNDAAESLFDWYGNGDVTWALEGTDREFRTTQPARPRARMRGVMLGYDRGVERAVHDRGGWQVDGPIDRTEHELADWELLTDALVGALGREGVMNVDELRRGIESMPRGDYERASYYERWLYSLETVLTEKGVLEPGELDRRLGG